MMTFVDPMNVANSQELLGAQVLGGPQPQLGGIDVTSAVVVKNISAAHVSATIELGGTDTIALGTIPPGMTRKVRVGEIGSKSVKVRYAGNPGALMGRIFGISADGEFGFYTPLAGGTKQNVISTCASMLGMFS